MSMHNLQAWSLTAIALTGGVGASLFNGDWSWFSRSGALVVAVGIILTSQQIFDHNRRLLEHQRFGQATSSHHPTAAQDWAGENSIHQLIRARNRQEDIWRKEFSGFQLLVGGTLIWGFGDLLGQILG